jgi:acetyl esterase/lipase
MRLLVLLLLVLAHPAAAAETAATTKPAKPARVQPDPVGEPVVYKKVDGRELRLWITKPDGWKPTDQRPALVMIHGGGWKGGYPGLHNAQAQYFAKRGMVSLIVEYRLLGRGSNKTDLPIAACQDAKSTIRYVRSHAKELGIDPDRIAASGSSAGGHLSAFASLVDGLDDPNDDLNVSPKANALLLFSPVLDLSPGTFNHERFGDRFQEFSPAHHVSDKAPPTIILIGTEDQYIKKEETERFRDDMLKHRARCEAVFFEGWEHGYFTTPRQRDRAIDEADRFLVSLRWLDASTSRPTTQPGASAP